MCLVWVFSIGVLLALFYFVSLLFRNVARQADFKRIQEAIKQAFSGLSANLTSVIESRLSDFKRDLVEERDSSVAFVVKPV